MSATNEAVVIGAGAAGLAAAGALRQRGIDSVVLERGQPGQSWHDRYEGLRINSWGFVSSLPGYRIGHRYGRWPKREAFAAYLAEYVQAMNLTVRTGVEVERVDRDHGGWRVQTSGGEIAARYVVVATGEDRVPRLPDWQGRDTYNRPLLHSSEYKRASDLPGQDVLVVGGGNSGCEIAAQLAERPAGRVRIAVRSGPLILARNYLGVPLTAWAVFGWPMPDPLLDLSGRFMQWYAFGDLTEYGLPAPAPDHQLSHQRRTGYVPTVDGGFVDALKQGHVTIVPSVDRFEQDAVVLGDGQRVEPDAVIAATGYTTGLEPLVGHLGVLRDDSNPKFWAGNTHPDAPGLFFIGYHFDLAALLPHLSTEARSIAKAITTVRPASAPRRVRSPLPR